MRTCVCMFSLVQLFATPWTVAHQILSPWDFSGKNPGLGCHFPLPGGILTQGSNSCLTCVLYYKCWRILYLLHRWGSLWLPWWVSGKESACNSGATGDTGSIQDQEDPLEEDMSTHSSNPEWRTPWTEEPGRLRSMRSQRVRHDWSDVALNFLSEKKYKHGFQKFSFLF